jgi:hypothetical protein
MRGWEHTIKMYRRKIGWKSVDWNQLARWEPAVGCCEDGNEHTNSMKGGEIFY